MSKLHFLLLPLAFTMTPGLMGQQVNPLPGYPEFSLVPDYAIRGSFGGAQNGATLHVWRLTPGAASAVTVSLAQGIIHIVPGNASQGADNILFMLPGSDSSKKSAGQVGPYRYSGDSTGFHIVATESIPGPLKEVRVIIPPGLKRLDLKITGHGGVIVEDFAGDLTVSNAGGTTRLDGISGTAFVDNKDGEIRATINKWPDAKSAGLMLMANNGNIILSVPDLSITTMDKIAFKFSASHGTIYSDFLPTDYSFGRSSSTPPNERMNLSPIVMGRPDGAAVTLNLTTINGSIVVVKK